MDGIISLGMYGGRGQIRYRLRYGGRGQIEVWEHWTG